MKTLRILAIDDHEMTMLGYKFILEGIDFEGHNIIVDTATSYQTGKKLIEDSVNTFRYDILFLDVQLFAPNEEQPYTGEDLGILARKIVPESKIVFMSSFSDNFRINSIDLTIVYASTKHIKNRNDKSNDDEQKKRKN